MLSYHLTYYLHKPFTQVKKQPPAQGYSNTFYKMDTFRNQQEVGGHESVWNPAGCH